MMTGQAGWAVYRGDQFNYIELAEDWGPHDSKDLAVDLARDSGEGYEAKEITIIPTAELDTLVAAGEARGAAAMKRKAAEQSCNRVHSKSCETCVYCEDENCIAIEIANMDTPDTQAHTQRQRDEGYNEGVEASAEAMKGSWDAGNKERVVTILALRKETP